MQKQCFSDPEGFALYFGNPALAAACEAWLGPDYQMTAQVNQVRPGGQAQKAHRDYHLGFQTAEGAARYPAHVHEVTATLTLQGAIAHVRHVPSRAGRRSSCRSRRPTGRAISPFTTSAFRDWFEEAHVQVPLSKGDAVFFNPALFHARRRKTAAPISTAW